MTLQEYIEKVRKDLVSFEAFWYKNNKKTPKDFPIQLRNFSDWDEQFLFFEEDQELLKHG